MWKSVLNPFNTDRDDESSSESSSDRGSDGNGDGANRGANEEEEDADFNRWSDDESDGMSEDETTIEAMARRSERRKLQTSLAVSAAAIARGGRSPRQFPEARSDEELEGEDEENQDEKKRGRMQPTLEFSDVAEAPERVSFPTRVPAESEAPPQGPTPLEEMTALLRHFGLGGHGAHLASLGVRDVGALRRTCADDAFLVEVLGFHRPAHRHKMHALLAHLRRAQRLRREQELRRLRRWEAQRRRLGEGGGEGDEEAAASTVPILRDSFGHSFKRPTSRVVRDSAAPRLPTTQEEGDEQEEQEEGDGEDDKEEDRWSTAVSGPIKMGPDGEVLGGRHHRHQGAGGRKGAGGRAAAAGEGRNASWYDVYDDEKDEDEDGEEEEEEDEEGGGGGSGGGSYLVVVSAPPRSGGVFQRARTKRRHRQRYKRGVEQRSGGDWGGEGGWVAAYARSWGCGGGCGGGGGDAAASAAAGALLLPWRWWLSNSKAVCAGVWAGLGAVPLSLALGTCVSGMGSTSALTGCAVLMLSTALAGGQPGVVPLNGAAVAVALRDLRHANQSDGGGGGDGGVGDGDDGGLWACSAAVALGGLLTLLLAATAGLPRPFLRLVPASALAGFRNGTALLVALAQLRHFQERTSGGGGEEGAVYTAGGVRSAWWGGDDDEWWGGDDDSGAGQWAGGETLWSLLLQVGVPLSAMLLVHALGRPHRHAHWRSSAHFHRHPPRHRSNKKAAARPPASSSAWWCLSLSAGAAALPLPLVGAAVSLLLEGGLLPHRPANRPGLRLDDVSALDWGAAPRLVWFDHHRGGGGSGGEDDDDDPWADPPGAAWWGAALAHWGGGGGRRRGGGGGGGGRRVPRGVWPAALTIAVSALLESLTTARDLERRTRVAHTASDHADAKAAAAASGLSPPPPPPDPNHGVGLGWSFLDTEALTLGAGNLLAAALGGQGGGGDRALTWAAHRTAAGAAAAGGCGGGCGGGGGGSRVVSLAAGVVACVALAWGGPLLNRLPMGGLVAVALAHAALDLADWDAIALVWAALIPRLRSSSSSAAALHRRHSHHHHAAAAAAAAASASRGGCWRRGAHYGPTSTSTTPPPPPPPPQPQPPPPGLCCGGAASWSAASLGARLRVNRTDAWVAAAVPAVALLTANLAAGLGAGVALAVLGFTWGAADRLTVQVLTPAVPRTTATATHPAHGHDPALPAGSPATLSPLRHLFHYADDGGAKDGGAKGGGADGGRAKGGADGDGPARSPFPPLPAAPLLPRGGGGGGGWGVKAEAVKVYVVRGELYFGSLQRFLECFDVRYDPRNVEVRLEHCDICDYSALQALNTLGADYAAAGKRLRLSRLRPASAAALRKGQGLLGAFGGGRAAPHPALHSHGGGGGGGHGGRRDLGPTLHGAAALVNQAVVPTKPWPHHHQHGGGGGGGGGVHGEGEKAGGKPESRSGNDGARRLSLFDHYRKSRAAAAAAASTPTMTTAMGSAVASRSSKPVVRGSRASSLDTEVPGLEMAFRGSTSEITQC